MPDISPGEGILAKAPLRKVTYLKDEPPIQIGEATTNPMDEGVYWALISGYANGAAEFDVGIYQMGMNQYHPRHFHPLGAEFYYVIHGSCLITVDDEEIEAVPGTAIYLPPKTVHAVRTRPNETMTMVYGFPYSDFREAGISWVE